MVFKNNFLPLRQLELNGISIDGFFRKFELNLYVKWKLSASMTFQ